MRALQRGGRACTLVGEGRRHPDVEHDEVWAVAGNRRQRPRNGARWGLQHWVQVLPIGKKACKCAVSD
jgi:hypothetical protein